MRRGVHSVIGVLEGLLLVRLVTLLFAARPDNAGLRLLAELSAPLVWPWMWLDRWAMQPREGARLELATLAAMLLLLLGAVVWDVVQSRRVRNADGVDR